jgi:hypothetical protein
MKNFKDNLWIILGVFMLIVCIGIPILIGILSVFDILSTVSSIVNRVFMALSDGNWLQGLMHTLFVIIGLTNLIRGLLIASPREEARLESLPTWAQTLILGLSLTGTVGFVAVFFSILME